MKMKPKMKTLKGRCRFADSCQLLYSFENVARASDESLSCICPSTATPHETSLTEASRRRGEYVRRSTMGAVDGRHARVEDDKTGTWQLGCITRPSNEDEGWSMPCWSRRLKPKNPSRQSDRRDCAGAGTARLGFEQAEKSSLTVVVGHDGWM